MIELMTAVSVVAILAALALPSYTESIKRQRLRVVVEAVVSDLTLAKADAFEQGARG